MCVYIYACVFVGTKAQRRTVLEPRSIGNMGRAYQSSARGLRGVANGKRGGKEEGDHRRTTKRRGEYLAKFSVVLSLDIKISICRAPEKGFFAGTESTQSREQGVQ